MLTFFKKASVVFVIFIVVTSVAAAQTRYPSRLSGSEIKQVEQAKANCYRWELNLVAGGWTLFSGLTDSILDVELDRFDEQDLTRKGQPFVVGFELRYRFNDNMSLGLFGEYAGGIKYEKEISYNVPIGSNMSYDVLQWEHQRPDVSMVGLDFRYMIGMQSWVLRPYFTIGGGLALVHNRVDKYYESNIVSWGVSNPSTSREGNFVRDKVRFAGKAMFGVQIKVVEMLGFIAEFGYLNGASVRAGLALKM